LGRLKSTIYARMEDVSFRSGAAVSAGVLAAAGVAITLAVALGGHSAAAPSPSAVARSTPPRSPVLPAAASPSSTARATPVASLMPAGAYQPPVPATVVTNQQAAASAVGLPTPRFLHRTLVGQSFPVVPNLGGPGSLSRAGAPEWRRHGRPDWDGAGTPAWWPGRL